MLEVLEDRTLPAPVTLLGVPNWIAEGPAPNADGQDENIAAEPGGGANAVSGAIQAIAVNPGNSANVFVGTVNGGIWRTTNFFAATTPWTPLTDQFPALEISALQFDPTDGANQTVVAGIGNTSNIITTLGPLTGLLKTTDGGASWAQLGNTAAQGLQGENVSAVLPRGATILVGVVSGAAPGLYRTTNNGSTFQLISGLNNLGNGPVYDVAADPSNNNRAYVVVGGATGGVFRTDDLGNSWTNITTNATITTELTGGNLSNAKLAVSAAAPNPVYLAIATNGQLGDMSTPAAGVFRSANLGASWTAMDLPLTLDAPRSIAGVSNTGPIVITTTANHGYATGDRVRITGAGGGANGDWTISVNAATPNQFTLIGSVAGGGAGAGGTVKNLQGILHGRQAFPNLALAADPGNANLVYIGGDRQDFLGADSSIGANAFSARIFRGDFGVPAQGLGSVVTDATHQWTPLTHSGTSNNSSPHADARALVIDAGTLLYAGDGGIFNENNPTTTTGRWFSDNGAPSGGNFGIQVTQFSSEISYDGRSNIIFGGAQDTGTPQQSAPGSLVYSDQTQGDGPFTAVDDLTATGDFPATVASARYIGFGRQYYTAANAAVGGNVNLLPSGGVNGSFFNFNALAVSTVAPPAGQSARVVIANGNGAANAQQTGTPGVALFDSTNAGIAATTAAIVYTQIPTGPNWAGVNTFFNISAMTEGGMLGGVANQNVLYAASGTRVFLRSTAGGTLTATAGQPAGVGFIQDIATDPTNWQIAYVTDGSRVFQTTDAGATWTNITGNLNDNLIHTITVANNGAGVSAVLVGETNGVFRMLSSAPGEWTKFGAGFPNSSVWGVVYNTANNVLVAGTSGRGAFEVQNASANLFTQSVLQICGDQDFANEDDTFRLVRDPVNNLMLDVFVNNTTSVPTFVVPLALVDQINVFGAGGNDNLIVDSSNGLITVPSGIRYDGDNPCPGQAGAGIGGFDTLTLQQTGGVASGVTDIYSVGPIDGSGISAITGPGGTQTVYFQRLEPVLDNVPAATATINATPASNAINYSPGPGGGIFVGNTGLITVDNQESYEFNNKTNLVINAGAGDDTINLNDSTIPAGLTGSITVNGQDPTASDKVIVNGTTGTDAINFAPTAADAADITGAGPVTIHVATVESLIINGRGGNDSLTVTTPAGADVLTLDPGALADQGTVSIRRGVGGAALLGLSFTNLGVNDALGRLSFANAGGGGAQDDLTLDGRDLANASDIFTVTAAGNVDLQTPDAGSGVLRLLLNLQTPGVSALRLNGLAGDDSFSIAGNHPFATGVFIDGGSPSASDTLNFTGSGTTANLITANLPAATVTEATFGAVSFTGVETVNIGAAGHNFTLVATGGDDALSVTPTAAGVGSFRDVASGASPYTSPQFTYTGVGATFTVNGGAGGFDDLGLNATAGNDQINAVQTDATHLSYTQNAFTQIFTLASIEGASLLTGAGDDLIRVSVADALEAAPAGSLRFTVDGGPPNASDRLIVNDDGIGDLTVLRQAADGHSGSVTVGALNPVVYSNVERLDITPLDPITGATGSDSKGRIVVFHADPFEFNDSRLNAGQIARVGQNSTSPTIDPGGVAAPFSANGDEDWYQFDPTSTNTFQVRILFTKIGALANGRPGLPGDGDLSLDIYDANGALITSGVADASGNNRTAVFAATNDPAFPQFNRIFVRVKGAGAQPAVSINTYDFTNLSGAGSGISGVSLVDILGPKVTAVNISDNPATATNEAALNIFVPKPTDGPTPLITSMDVHLSDSPLRAPGFLYPAIDATLFAGTPGHRPAMGLFSVVGDRVGNVPIADVVLTNDPVVQGQLATATVKIIFDTGSPTFAGGLPDDRYTITVNDGLFDPPGNKLDGENNAVQPTAAPSFPSGNNQSGGNFAARFTVDSRPEIGLVDHGQTRVDINANGVYDPLGSGDAVNHDLAFIFGLYTDSLFAGNFAKNGVANGFDKFGAYGKTIVNGANVFRFLLDLNGDGKFSAGDLQVISTRQINGLPVAGNFAPGHPGDEIGLFDGVTWYLDTNANNDIDFGDTTVTDGLRGYPIVGDFDGDGKVDLGAYQPDTNTFQFDLQANGFGQIDATINVDAKLNAPAVAERPVAADINQDGITDIGLFLPQGLDPQHPVSGNWYFLVSDRLHETPVVGMVNMLDHAFNQQPFTQDVTYNFGNGFEVPIIGNFDPPTAASGAVSTAALDKVFSGDLDGDGKADYAAFDSGSATWNVQLSGGGTLSKTVGAPGDTPIRADFDGDGKADLATYHAANGLWTILTSNSNFTQTTTRYFGGDATDTPLAIDFDGDGKADLAVFRARTGQWLITTAKTNYTDMNSFQWGQQGDVALNGDVDGDGKADLIVFRPNTGQWLIRTSGSGYSSNVSYLWGQAGDIPMTADFDGDGQTDLAVRRPATGQWLILESTRGYSAAARLMAILGNPADVGLVNDYDGDGGADIGVFNPATGAFSILTSSSGFASTQTATLPPPPADIPLNGDYDGDGRPDLAVFRPTTGQWFIRNSSTNFATTVTFQWGQNGDVPLVGDFDGDGKADTAVFRPGSGQWLIRGSATGAFFTIQFGQAGDTPFFGKLDGDNKADLLLYRPGTQQWFVRTSASGYSGIRTIQWGMAGDTPKVGDFDGDGKTDLLAYRPSLGQWFIDQSGADFTTSAVVSLGGAAGDLPVVGFFDGDKRVDLGVFRPSTGQWLLAQSTAGAVTRSWGLAGDVPLTGDFDGDGKSDLIVYRPTSGVWYIDRSLTNFADYLTYQWGNPLEIAI
ncbi:MAG: FG-GAP-like repeat-containing protein [Gemmataceae bacterium]